MNKDSKSDEDMVGGTSTPTPTKKSLGLTPPPKYLANTAYRLLSLVRIRRSRFSRVWWTKDWPKIGKVLYSMGSTPQLPEIKRPNELIGGAPACAANSSHRFPTDDGRMITLTSMFDSGNMAKAEQFSDNSYGIWTAPDCENTDYVTGYRTWFHFAIKGFKKGDTITFTIMNMNKQTGLFQHDHRPSFCSSPFSTIERTIPVSKYKIHEEIF